MCDLHNNIRCATIDKQRAAAAATLYVDIMAAGGEDGDRESVKSKSTVMNNTNSTCSTASERSPLLGGREDTGRRREQEQEQQQEQRLQPWGASIIFKLLFTSTIVSLSFGVTQVP